MSWYLAVLKKYAVFSGRARRKEYWFFVLFNFLISIALIFVDSAIGSLDANSGFGILSGIYSLGVLIPSLAVTVRRLHDTDRTGWWFLIAFIPLIGVIVLLVFMFLDGTPGNNSYGADPKAQQE
jgi:uncharacterized membrane protein YhaH (DUF805 family)